MSVKFAKPEEEQCDSHLKSNVRCLRVKGHDGWHQDARHAWPTEQQQAQLVAAKEFA